MDEYLSTEQYTLQASVTTAAGPRVRLYAHDHGLHKAINLPIAPEHARALAAQLVEAANQAEAAKAGAR
jgi:hypothetical protein